jgi:hypothetical protein
VTETGWGEFEIVIKIYFNDPNERPVNIFLFQTIQNKCFVSQSLYLEKKCSILEVFVILWGFFIYYSCSAAIQK